MNRRGITSTLRKEGLPLELVKGDSYWYFEFDDGVRFETHCVWVYRFHQLSDERWLEEGREFAKRVQFASRWGFE